MRPLLSLAVAATAVATSLSAPAHADARGCSGSFSGATSCSFTLLPGDSGVELTIHVASGSDPVASRFLCCALVNPLTGERLHDVNGEPFYLASGLCGTSAGGSCSTSVQQPPGGGVIHDASVFCEVAGEDGSTISGTWSCLPTS